MTAIGFIGLGIMGKPMSLHLLRAGHQLVVLSSNSAASELVAAGARQADTSKAVAEQADLIITMLPNSPEVEEVVLGADGVIEGARPGSVVIDMSSISPIASREIAAKLKEKGIEMLDAPVSGGEPKAIEGTLSVMVGGDEAVFERSREILQTMAASVVRTGEIGAGNVTKLANQVMVGLHLAAMSEAFTLATKSGVDPALVFQAIRGGLAGSAVLEAKAPLVMERKFDPGFRMRLHHKDLVNVKETAEVFEVPMPLTEAVRDMMQSLNESGYGEDDHGALIRYYEQLAQIEVGQ